MKLIPLGERIILKPVKAEERTKSGIYLPKSSEEKKEGIVQEVGTLKNGSLIPLKKGDKVIYGGYSNEEFELNSEKLLIVDFKDVLARVEDRE
ncbi:MAG: co-chaperone GroES [Nanoarchaeota archaeon]|nr:co-chaperone GroES [Nanoarchaeota archaeon]MBU1051441.1 co-chaperone GroES [Nanoarchaeota archaeon]MBU1988648.1 co-chaperone GroES [Nanoarchaeota archaeon]